MSREHQDMTAMGIQDRRTGRIVILRPIQSILTLNLPIFKPCSLAFLQRRRILDPSLARGLMGGPLLEDNVLAILVVERVKLGEGPSLLLLWRRPNGGDVVFAKPGLATRRTWAPLAAPNRVSKQFLDEREKSRNASADQDKVCFDASRPSACHTRLIRGRTLTLSRGLHHPPHR